MNDELQMNTDALFTATLTRHAGVVVARRDTCVLVHRRFGMAAP